MITPPGDTGSAPVERALAAAGAIAWEWDIETGACSLSAGAVSLLSLKDDPAAGFLTLVHADDRTWLQPLIKQAAQGEAPYDFEFRLVRPDGEVEWVRDRGQLIRDAEGRPKRLAGVAQLITEQKRTKDALIATFEQAAVGMAHVAPDGSFLKVNACLCRILARSRDALLGLTFQDITYPEDLDADLIQLNDLLAGRTGFYSMEKRYLRPDGSLLWANLTVSLVRKPNGSPDYFISVVEDISARKALEAVADADAIARGFMEVSPDCVKLLDARGCILDMNQAGLRLLGITGLDSVRGRSWAELWPETARPEIGRVVANVKAGQPARFITYRPTATGIPRWWDTEIWAVPGTDQRLLAVSRAINVMAAQAQGASPRTVSLVSTGVLAGGGEMGKLMRAYDWAASPVGPVETWPQALRTAVRLMLNTRHPMFLWWGESLTCFYNDAYSALIGPDRHPSCLGQPGRQVWAEIWNIIGPQIDLVMAGKGATWHERQLIPITRGDKLEDVWWTYGYSPVDDEHAPNGVGGVLVVCRDVTAEVMAERALTAALAAKSEREQQLRLFIERAPAAIAMFDTEMRYLAVSRRFVSDLRLKHEQPEELVGRSHYELFPDIPERWRDVHRRVFAGEFLSADDDPYPRADGTVDWIRWEMTPWRHADGSIGGAALFSEVITEHRAAKIALLESEELFRSLAEAMPQMAYIARPDGYNEFQNRRWSLYTGVPQEESIGERWAELVHPDDLARTWAAWRHSLQTGEIYNIEHRLRRKDGQYLWFLTRAEPLRDPSANIIVRWLGTSTDITDIVDAREVLARSQAQLETMVEERTRDLQDSQVRLAHLQRMEALGQLAGGIAHDFNNVLQSVQGGAQLIERRPGDPESVRRIARVVSDAAERGASITRRLLAFARRGDLRAEAVDPISLLTDMREMLTHTLGAGVGVRVDASTTLPPMLVDKGQLETVLVNLATNARDAMAGHGTLTLAAAAETVEPGNAQAHPAGLTAGAYICVSVADTGSGMTPDVLARVTEPFFTTKDHGEGTGLGLPMAKGFAEQSGGALYIESAPGQGTTVRLWFPLAAASPADTPPSLGNGVGEAARHAHLLLVDDEPLVREIMREELEAVGYTVITASDGASALAILDSGVTVDLMISDLSMPAMDGVSLVKQAQRRRPKLPAILLTGFATNAAEIAVGGAVSGTFTLLRKPIGVGALAERVALLLEAIAAGKT